jgi:hypothetical protein
VPRRTTMARLSPANGGEGGEENVRVRGGGGTGGKGPGLRMETEREKIYACWRARQHVHEKTDSPTHPVVTLCPCTSDSTTVLPLL